MTDFYIYTTGAECQYVVTSGDPSQAIRGNLPDMLRLWARLDQFVRDQEPDGTIRGTDPLATAADFIEAADAVILSRELDMPIQERTLRYNLNARKVPGAVKRGGRWVVPRGAFVEWLRQRQRQ